MSSPALRIRGEKTSIKRLEHRFTVISTRVMVAVFLIVIWTIPWVQGSNQGPQPMGYFAIISVITIVLLLWIRRMRQVSFDGDHFIIKDWFLRPVEVPKSHLVKVRAVPVNRGLSWLTLKFEPPTKFGTWIRVMTGETWRSSKFLRLAAQMTAIAEKRPVKPAKQVDNDKVVEVRGWSREDVHRIVDDFIAMYESPDLVITVSAPSGGTISLHFPNDIDPQLFIFLVNYLHYPEGFDSQHESISARGTCVLSANFKLPDSKLVGKRATFFVPANDTEYDFVVVTIESGETYRIPFTDLKWVRQNE